MTTPQDRLTIEGLRQTVADLRERRCDFECLICKPTASFPSNCDHMALIATLRDQRDAHHQWVDACTYCGWAKEATPDGSER
jgi:hypothetical protein